MSKLGELLLGKKDIDKDLKLLLIIGGLYALSVALSNTFVNVYLWKQKNDYMTIALYNISIAVTQSLIIILAGRWAKQIDRVIVLRLGVFFLSFFYVTVLLLGDLAASYVVIVGILLGIGYAFYWLAFNILTFEITEPDTRDFFNGFFGLLTSLAGMTGPFFAGWLIARMKGFTGYTIIFAISLSLFILAVITSFFLRRRKTEGKFCLRNVLNWQEMSPSWKRILFSNVGQGLREGILPSLITVWIFVAAGSELALGTYSLITSAISLLAYYVIGRFISNDRRQGSILIGSILLSLAVFFILFHLTYPTLLTYGIIVSIAFPLLFVPVLSMTYDAIGQAKQAAEWRIEYVVLRELVINSGRVISVLLFLISIALFPAEQTFPYLIFILGNIHLLIYFFIRNVQI